MEKFRELKFFKDLKIFFFFFENRESLEGKLFFHRGGESVWRED